MKIGEFALEELTSEDYLEIIGGESLWYWVFYGVSSVVGFMKENAGTLHPSQYR